MPQLRDRTPRWQMIAALGSGLITGYALLLGAIAILNG
jgi:hypothetical protein